MRVIAHNDRFKRLRVLVKYSSGLIDSFSSDIARKRNKGDKQLKGDHHYFSQSSKFSIYKIFKDRL